MKADIPTKDSTQSIPTHDAILTAFEGVDSEREYTGQDIKRIKGRRSFARWKELRALIENGAPVAEILLKMHLTIDTYRGYGSRTNSDYSLESLNLVLNGVSLDEVRA